MNLPSDKRAGMAVLLALGFAIPASIAVAADSPAPASEDKKKDDAKVVEMEKFEVVGSRIKRTEVEGPQPVFTFTTADIQSRGFTSLGEFMQRLSFNSGTANSTVQTASFTRGAATANPRGLGSGRFLVLINGRRAATYPLTTGPQTLGYNASVFDFNSIPLGAIDQLEFLKDGASAIYGSDAVTGVLNIKLKRNFQGLSVDYLAGNTTGGHDMFFQEANVTAGAKSDKTQVMATVSYRSSNSTFIRDYQRSRTTDYLGVSGDTNKALNQNSTLNFPANVTLTAAQAAAAGLPPPPGTATSATYVIAGGVPTANATKSQFVPYTSTTIPNANRYDFAQTYQLFPDTTYLNSFVSARHDFSENLYAFGQLVYSGNMTHYAFTPSVIQSTQNPGTAPSGTLAVSATNPYNPFGIQLTNFLLRTNFGPPRLYDVESTGASGLAGIGGKINEDWSWEIGATFAQSSVASVGRNQIRAVDLQNALNGTTRTTAMNPFGPSDNPAIVNALFTVSNSVYKNKGQIYDANLTGKLFEIEGREVGIAVGGELRKEILRHDPDTQAYVGSGGGTPFKGSRNVKSGYLEITAPVLKQVEVQLATRYEKYSDFGDTTKPKVGAKFRPLDWLVIRGSFSQSFKAPDLGTLYTAQTTSFTSTVLADPKRPSDPPVQMKTVSGGNPNLQPEEADIWYGGIVVDVPRVKGLEFTADYFKFELTNLINSPSAANVLANEDRIPGSVIRDTSVPAPGPILNLRTVPFNVATQVYEGVDLGLTYRLNGTRFGDFKFETAWTRIISLTKDLGFGNGAFEYVGTYNNPKWNGNAGVSWEKEDWAAAVGWNYYGSYYNDGYTALGWFEAAEQVYSAQIAYRGFKGVRVTLGVQNLFNNEPPFNGRETSSFDQGTYGWLAAGRTVTIKVAKDF